MNRILHLDLSTGASGDKLLAALLVINEKLELTSFEELKDKAQAILPEVHIEREMVVRGGVSAAHISVIDSHQHHHRTWRDIQLILKDAASNGIVSDNAVTLALKVFERIALAEASVHGVAPEDVHFHEVGAADSIIDVLFNSFLLECIKPSAVYATPLALGNGTVFCAHGELPVPAPATAEILAGSGVPVYASSHEGELTTPTGAALIAEFVSRFVPLPCSEPLACGYGAGSRQLEGAANVVRIICATPAPLAGISVEEEGQLLVEGVIHLACNIDHLSPEALAFACEELLAYGALDVWQESITMKKGRLASKLQLLVKPEQASEFAQKTIALTGTLGIRSTYLERATIAREVRVLATPYGPVSFKCAQINTLDSSGAEQEQNLCLRPEHEDIARIARERDLSYSDVQEELVLFAERSMQS